MASSRTQSRPRPDGQDGRLTRATSPGLLSLNLKTKAIVVPEDPGTMRRVLYITTEPDRVPPGPWTWQHVRPVDAPDRGPDDIVPASTGEEGIALVAADDTWLLWSEGGYGTPELFNRAVEGLVRKAWRVPHLVSKLDEVTAKLDEARRIARHLYDADGRLPPEYGVGREPAPDWLTSPEPPMGP